MALSTAAKVGTAGTITAGGGVAGTYLAWDRITLYEVEREVINRDLKLKVEKDSGQGSNDKAIKIDIDTTTPLPSEYKWSCKIVVDSSADVTSQITNLIERLQHHLPTANATSKKNEKILLVKNCAKSRKEGYNSKSVEGEIKITKKPGSETEFESQAYPWLNYLFDVVLYEAESRVIEKDLKLNVTNDSSKITVTSTNTTSNGTTLAAESPAYSWTCEINLDSTITSEASTLKGKVEASLPTGSSVTEKQKQNRKLLVRACAYNRNNNPAPNENTVKGQLTLKKENNSYKFDNFPELKPILG